MNSGLALWKRAVGSIPGGNGLLSKRPDRYAPDIWPTYFKECSGAEVVDLDGNRYVDMAQMGIGSAILGYAHPELTEAVCEAARGGGQLHPQLPRRGLSGRAAAGAQSLRGRREVRAHRGRGHVHGRAHRPRPQRARQGRLLGLPRLERLVSGHQPARGARGWPITCCPGWSPRACPPGSRTPPCPSSTTTWQTSSASWTRTPTWASSAWKARATISRAGTSWRP